MSSEENTWDDWEEKDEDSTQCLFCNTKSLGVTAALAHMQGEHKFDLKASMSRFAGPNGHVNMYDVIRIINYIRSTNLNAQIDEELAKRFASLGLGPALLSLLVVNGQMKSISSQFYLKILFCFLLI